MSLFSMFKKGAKKSLENNWGSAMLVVFTASLTSAILAIFMYFTSVTLLGDMEFFKAGSLSVISFHSIGAFFDSVSDFSGSLISLTSMVLIDWLIILLILIPLYKGVKFWFYKLAKGEVLPVGGVFHFFENGKRYRRSIWTQINKFLRKSFWAIIFFAIPTALMAGTFFLRYRFTDVFSISAYKLLFSIAIILLVVLYLMAMIMYCSHINKYFLTDYLMFDDDLLKSGEAIKKSAIQSNGFRFKKFWFSTSFIGWFVISIPMFFLMLYTVPYYQSSVAIMAQFIMETHKRENPIMTSEMPVESDELVHAQIISPIQQPIEHINPNRE